MHSSHSVCTRRPYGITEPLACPPGNVYAKFREEEDAERALKKLYASAPAAAHLARTYYD